MVGIPTNVQPMWLRTSVLFIHLLRTLSKHMAAFEFRFPWLPLWLCTHDTALLAYPSAVDRAPAHPRALIELVGRRLSGADRPAVLAYNVQRLSKKTEDTRICTSYDRTHTLSLNSNDIGERTTKRASRPQPAIYVLCAAQRTRLILRDPSSGYVGTVRTHQIPGTQQAISWQTTLMSVSSPRSDHLCVVAAHPHTHTKQLGHLP